MLQVALYMFRLNIFQNMKHKLEIYLKFCIPYRILFVYLQHHAFAGMSIPVFHLNITINGKKRTISFLENYENIFFGWGHGILESPEKKERTKVHYNVSKTKRGYKGDWIKKIKDSETWEFKTDINNKFIRLMAFEDNTTTPKSIIITHGFLKKKNKTPKKEILKTESIRRDYLNS